ncbi:hypothetical protein GPALN_006646 [Globodera pallida]|nr:hypothetical protein GPALN_006646 [Globodera pallida]
MKELAASLMLLFAISIHPYFCAGLECKKGWAQHGPNNYTDEDIYKNSACPANAAKYCVAAACTKGRLNVNCLKKVLFKSLCVSKFC